MQYSHRFALVETKTIFHVQSHYFQSTWRTLQKTFEKWPQVAGNDITTGPYRRNFCFSNAQKSHTSKCNTLFISVLGSNGRQISLDRTKYKRIWFLSYTHFITSQHINQTELWHNRYICVNSWTDKNANRKTQT